jgi:hypothetical protein
MSKLRQNRIKIFDLNSIGYARVVFQDCCLGIGEIRQTALGHELVPQTVLI